MEKNGAWFDQQIARIAINPKDPNIVYVAAQGAIYSPPGERGIYKSVDGGVTWKNVLFVDRRPAVQNYRWTWITLPFFMHAAMGTMEDCRGRYVSGGPGSGLYKSTDLPGEHWEKNDRRAAKGNG